jgi:hypothetical protein
MYNRKMPTYQLYTSQKQQYESRKPQRMRLPGCLPLPMQQIADGMPQATARAKRKAKPTPGAEAKQMPFSRLH